MKRFMKRFIGIWRWYWIVQVSGQAVSRGPSCERLHVFRNNPHGPVQTVAAPQWALLHNQDLSVEEPLHVHSLGALP